MNISYLVFIALSLLLVEVQTRRRKGVVIKGTTLPPDFVRKESKASLRCPLSHPFVFGKYKLCCKEGYEISKDSYFCTFKGQPNDVGQCCSTNDKIRCPRGRKCTNHPDYSSKIQFCPRERPFALGAGSHCCSLNVRGPGCSSGPEGTEIQSNDNSDCCSVPDATLTGCKLEDNAFAFCKTREDIKTNQSCSPFFPYQFAQSGLCCKQYTRSSECVSGSGNLEAADPVACCKEKRYSPCVDDEGFPARCSTNWEPNGHECDLKGYEITDSLGSTHTAANAADCKLKCQKNSVCEYYTFDFSLSTSNCFFKASADNVVQNSNKISGLGICVCHETRARLAGGALSKSLNIVTVEDCKELCVSTELCVQYEYFPASDICDLKNGGAERSYTTEYVVTGPKTCHTYRGELDCLQDGQGLKDVAFATIFAADVNTCLFECQHNAGCNYYTYDHSLTNNNCFLHKTFQMIEDNPSRSWGWKSCLKECFDLDTDAIRGDLKQIENVANAHDCQKHCQNYPTCTKFTYLLKNAAGGRHLLCVLKKITESYSIGTQGMISGPQYCP